MTRVELEARFCNFSLIASNIFELTQFVFITDATFGFKNCHKDYRINFFIFFFHNCTLPIATLYCALFINQEKFN